MSRKPTLGGALWENFQVPKKKVVPVGSNWREARQQLKPPISEARRFAYGGFGTESSSGLVRICPALSGPPINGGARQGRTGGENAGMAELVDARDLGSRALCVRVRVSLPVSIYILFRGV